MRIERIRRIDDTGEGVQEFITKMILSYDLDRANAEVVYRKTTRNAFDIEQCVVDNSIVEIVHSDKLVAMVYIRRTNFNWTETTFIDFYGVETK